MEEFKEDLRRLLKHFQYDDGKKIRSLVWDIIVKYLFDGKYSKEKELKQLKQLKIEKFRRKLKKLGC